LAALALLLSAGCGGKRQRCYKKIRRRFNDIEKKYKKYIMNKAIMLAILAGGIVLVVYGVSASKSFSSDISRFFTGSPTDKAIWMLVGRNCRDHYRAGWSSIAWSS
jgi:hypothetical protein